MNHAVRHLGDHGIVGDDGGGGSQIYVNLLDRVEYEDAGLEWSNQPLAV